MSNNPLVTVIIPSFNHATYIVAAVDSVLSQDYDNFELIVIDDGSSDQTARVMATLPADPRLRIVLNESNRGQSAVVNQALAMSKGVYVCILPSDDWYLPSKLSVQVRKFLECDNETGVVYGRGLRYFSDTGRTVPVDLPLIRGQVLRRLITHGNFVYPATPMFRRECFDFAIPDESYRAEGEAIYLKIALKYKFDFVEDIVAVMRDHEFNTGRQSAMMYVDNLRYWNEFFDRTDLPADIRGLRRIPLARLHRLKGLEAIMLEQASSKARVALLAAIKLRPSYLGDFTVILGLLLSLLPRKLLATLLALRK
ncbi:MAG: glycosyltransferase [Casimicrobium sp.]